MPDSRPDLSAPVADRIEKLPAEDIETGRALVEGLLEAGPDTVRKLVLAVGEKFGDPAGVKPKYAVHGIVHCASQPGREGPRKMVAGVLAAELAAEHSADLKAFLCRQLQLCGASAEVSALAPLLDDDELCEPAAQALSAIGGEQALAALRSALPESTGDRRTTLVNALGQLGDSKAAAEIRKSIAAEDAELRNVTLYALASAGDAAAAGALVRDATGQPGYARNEAFDACLRLARRLGSAGKQSESRQVLRQLADSRKLPGDRHDLCALLETLAALFGADAVPETLEALGSQNLWYRAAAARIGLDLARDLQKKSPAEARKLLTAVLEATQEEAVRQEAARLLGAPVA